MAYRLAAAQLEKTEEMEEAGAIYPRRCRREGCGRPILAAYLLLSLFLPQGWEATKPPTAAPFTGLINP
jgi:hypothetical protein